MTPLRLPTSVVRDEEPAGPQSVARGQPRGACIGGITSTVLNRAADPTVDHRPRGAMMADTLVQRVTGRPAGTPEPVAVNLVLSDQTLLGGDDTPAVVDGYGPIPAVLFGRDPILRPLRFLRLRLPLGYLRLPVCAGPCGFRGPARVASGVSRHWLTA